MALETGPQAAVKRSTVLRNAAFTLIVLIAFGVYTIGIYRNPPGFYLDESGISYNAYLVSTTGAGEFGPKFPLYFQLYTGGYAQFSNPIPVYTLAAVFLIFGPSVLIARLTASAAMFTACLLLGLLAYRISRQRSVGLLVTAIALLTPWLFELGRLVMDPMVYALVLAGFLWSVYLASERSEWTWQNIAAIVLMLALTTYSYTIGRLLAPMLAFGLILFAANRKILFDVLKVWALYAVTLIPLAMFVHKAPELMTRFQLLTYIKSEMPVSGMIGKFVARYLEDINPYTMIVRGDINPRHHIPDAFGSFYLSVFLLAVTGIVIVLSQYRDQRWWRYVTYGMLVSVIPGALTVDSFHSLRLIALPLFLLILAIPALQWLLSSGSQKGGLFSQRPAIKQGAVILLGVVFAAEAINFHVKHYSKGPARGYVFDTAYKQLYDVAVANRDRPIYLLDAYWGPAYIHSYWYAALDGRDNKEFVHLPYGVRPPPESIVISSEQACTDCQMLRKEGIFLLYKTLK